MSTVIVRPVDAPPHATLARTALFLGCSLVLLLGLYLAAKGNPGHRVAAPLTFLSYLAPDKSFVCDAPVGWAAHEAGVEGGQGAHVLFQQDAAKVEINTDQASGAMADMMNATNAQLSQAQSDAQSLPAGAPAMPAVPAPVPAVEQLHRMDLAQYQALYEDYAEQPVHAFQSQLGAARLSEWTGRGLSSGTRLHGYRVTMLGRDKRICLNCRCPEGDWKALQPAFVRVIHSVAQGPG